VRGWRLIEKRFSGLSIGDFGRRELLLLSAVFAAPILLLIPVIRELISFDKRPAPNGLIWSVQPVTPALPRSASGHVRRRVRSGGHPTEMHSAARNIAAKAVALPSAGDAVPASKAMTRSPGARRR
jgi:hypothetical protein